MHFSIYFVFKGGICFISNTEFSKLNQFGSNCLLIGWTLNTVLNFFIFMIFFRFSYQDRAFVQTLGKKGEWSYNFYKIDWFKIKTFGFRNCIRNMGQFFKEVFTKDYNFNNFWENRSRIFWCKAIDHDFDVGQFRISHIKRRPSKGH